MALPAPGSEERPDARAVTTAIEDAAVALDAAGRVLAWNDAARRHAGIPADAVGRAVAEVIAAPDVASATRLDLAGGGAILAWPGPRPVGDDDVAREKARILEHLAPGVAHDLINQVGGIQGFLQVLEDGDAHDRELLDATAVRAMDTVKAFQGMVRSRLTGPTSIAPAGLVAECVALSAHPLAEVALSVDVPDGLPDVEGEPVHLRQALLAVLVSTMDALGWPAAHGSIRLGARATGRRVEITIEDDGPAIDGGQGDGLFDATTGTVAGRDALDLAVARYLLRLDAGDLSYAPRPGGGNRFVLAVPTGAEAVDDGEHADPDEQLLARERLEPAARDRVLVCDDEDSVRSLVVRVLRRAGLETAEAASGPAALQVLEAGSVSLVVADHHLGPMSGLELYEIAVAADPSLRGRFILMSGDAGDVDLVEFARTHGLPIVAKPFTDLNELAAMVRSLAAA